MIFFSFTSKIEISYVEGRMSGVVTRHWIISRILKGYPVVSVQTATISGVVQLLGRKMDKYTFVLTKRNVFDSIFHCYAQIYTCSIHI